MQYFWKLNWWGFLLPPPLLYQKSTWYQMQWYVPIPITITLHIKLNAKPTLNPTIDALEEIESSFNGKVRRVIITHKWIVYAMLHISFNLPLQFYWGRNHDDKCITNNDLYKLFFDSYLLFWLKIRLWQMLKCRVYRQNLSLFSITFFF